MSLFIAYIKMKRKTVWMCVLFAAIFVFSFILYRLPVSAILYPICLCLVASAVFVGTDFLRFRRKHHYLSQLTQQKAFLVSDASMPDNTVEEDYQRIIALLKQELSDFSDTQAAKYRDTVEYYTVWAHQIKTPIASMRLSLDNEDTPFSRKISSDLFRIEQYVEMVLAFLRLDSPSTDYVLQTHSVDKMIKSALHRVAPDFITKKLRLIYDETGMVLVTDEKWFCFVLEQLLTNALKYTREGEIRIFGAQEKLYIADSGIGIDEADIPRVFEKGYTGINGRRDKSASGIGLYLCKRVCDNLGVGLSLSSEVGKGTTVCLELSQYDGLKK